MIASPEKIEDMKARAECLELMEGAIKQGFIEEAKEFGRISAKYTEMLKGNYKERDKKWAIYHKLHL